MVCFMSSNLTFLKILKPSRESSPPSPPFFGKKNRIFLGGGEITLLSYQTENYLLI